MINSINRMYQEEISVQEAINRITDKLEEIIISVNNLEEIVLKPSTENVEK